LTETYRWNVADHAAGYDAAADVIHPYYVEIQEAILDRIARPRDARFLLVDLGGGSGRLAEKFLARFPNASAVVVDQSAAFLEIAARRMAPFGGRGTCVTARLQDDWASRLAQPLAAIVSMSAIHHLAPDEKQDLYRRAYEALTPLGVFLNGDECRDADDARYRAWLERWGQHLLRIVDEGRVNAAMRPMFEKWIERNLTRFDEPRVSGDDCHETIEAQLAYLCDCGFRSVGVPWRKDMWAVLEAVK
jgi:tRNA (cmo5U34)-methyltransferase